MPAVPPFLTAAAVLFIFLVNAEIRRIFIRSSKAGSFPLPEVSHQPASLWQVHWNYWSFSSPVYFACDRPVSISQKRNFISIFRLHITEQYHFNKPFFVCQAAELLFSDFYATLAQSMRILIFLAKQDYSNSAKSSCLHYFIELL